jgi:hypothetical protein
MGYLPPGTINARHEVIGDSGLVEVRAGLEFSHRSNRFPVGSPNLAIAARMAEDQQLIELPIIASQTVADGLRQVTPGIQVTKVFDGPSAKGLQENTGTYGELEQLKRFMFAHDYRSVALYSSAYNIGNIIRQSGLLGLDIVVPPNMPRGFDRHSDQLWTQNWFFWTALAVPRIRSLRRSGH